MRSVDYRCDKCGRTLQLPQTDKPARYTPHYTHHGARVSVETRLECDGKWIPIIGTQKRTQRKRDKDDDK